MVSVLAFISGVIRGGASLTGPTESWAATKTGNTNGIAASNRFMGYSVFGSCSTVWDTCRERPDVLGGPPEGSGSVHLVRSRARPTKFLNPDFPDEPLILAQNLRKEPWFSWVFARFLLF